MIKFLVSTTKDKIKGGKKMKKLIPIGILVVFTVVMVVTFSNAMMKGAMRSSQSSLNLKTDMRKLWEDHVAWTRMYIVSALGNLEDVGQVAERLLRNQEDLGNAIKPLYGKEAGDKLTVLLKDHILIAADLVKAAKESNGTQAAEAEKKWYANADDIATFLSGANPNWPKQTLVNLLYAHLAMTKDEVVARLNKDYKAEITAYDKGREHMLMVADVLTDGIVKQFPEKFKK